MQHIRSTARAAGAQSCCADLPAENPAGHDSLRPRATWPGMGAIADQPGFAPITRREIMAAVHSCARNLGLGASTLGVLDALLSFLPCRDRLGREMPVTPAMLLTVHASNETLSFRARGLTDRQLRRHLDKLETLGLIRRRDSANGKRFAVRAGGRVIGAFGLDLSPLFARSREMVTAAQQQREAGLELRGLRARIQALRAGCEGLQLDAATTAFLAGLRNILRRTSLTLTEARALLEKLTAVNSGASLANHTAAEIDSDGACHDTPPHDNALAPPASAHGNLAARPVAKPAADGQNVRHKEPKSDPKKYRPDQDPPAWAELTAVNCFYPAPTSAHEAQSIAFGLGRMLGIRDTTIAEACARLGVSRLLALENRMAEGIETLRSPDAWLRAILGSARAPRDCHG